MALFSDFMPHILPYAKGCSIPLAEQHLRAIVLDFCSHAPIVQETLEPIDVQAGQREYELDMPMGTELMHILQANWGQRRLQVGVAPTERGISLLPHTGTPMAVQQGTGNGFQFDCVPAESARQALHLRVSTKPSRHAGRVADILLTDYGYEIGQGVVGRLLLIPGQAFSAPGLAAAYSGTYLTARINARIRAEHGFSPGGMRAQPRRFI